MRIDFKTIGIGVNRRRTMPAGPERMFDDAVGRGRLAQRVALVARLAAAQFARTSAKTAGDARLLFQPIARWRLGDGQTVLIEPPTKLGVLGAQCLALRPQRRDLAAKRFYQRLHVGRGNHPHLDSHFPRSRQTQQSNADAFVWPDSRMSPTTRFAIRWTPGTPPQTACPSKSSANRDASSNDASGGMAAKLPPVTSSNQSTVCLPSLRISPKSLAPA